MYKALHCQLIKRDLQCVSEKKNPVISIDYIFLLKKDSFAKNIPLEKSRNFNPL